jgi:tripartite-type tricarboxylate transporter receptor subunit TctC
MVHNGRLRLLATWGEQRTSEFKNVPTLRAAGYDVVVDAPNGAGAPKGLDPAVASKLRESLKVSDMSPEFKSACDKIDAPILYLDGPDYEKYVATIYQKEKVLIERLNLRELIQKG